jgi:hypothetical protein
MTDSEVYYPGAFISKPPKVICDICFEEVELAGVQISFRNVTEAAATPYARDRDYHVCVRCFAKKLGVTP